MKKRFCTFLILSFWTVSSVYAQAGDVPEDEVSEPKLLSIRDLSEQGKYLEAILRADEDQSYKPLGEIVASAKSAWALSLVSSARKYWDQALAHKDCVGVERARALLARSLMEFQEMNYEVARGLAEEGTALIGESELRGELWLLIGESLKAQDLFSISESYFEKAVKEAGSDRKQEALLSLAQTQRLLGKNQEARITLTKVELNSKITPKALTELVNIDASINNSQGVKTWINEGRKLFPSEFNAGENSYKEVKALLADGQLNEASLELERVGKEVREDDAWLQLSRALVEEKQARSQLSITEEKVENK